MNSFSKVHCLFLTDDRTQTIGEEQVCKALSVDLHLAKVSPQSEAIRDAVSEIDGVPHLETVLDKFYKTCNSSPKTHHGPQQKATHSIPFCRDNSINSRRHIWIELRQV